MASVIVYRDCRDHAPTLPSEPWPTIPSRLRTPGISCPPSPPLHYLSLLPLLPRKAKHFQACLSARTRCDHPSVLSTWTSVVWTVCFRSRCSSTLRFIETLPHPASTHNFAKSVIPRRAALLIVALLCLWLSTFPRRSRIKSTQNGDFSAFFRKKA